MSAAVHAFGCAGDGGCNCGCSVAGAEELGEAETEFGGVGMDPLSLILDTSASFLPVPEPLRNAASAAARQVLPGMLPPGAQAALDDAKERMDKQVAAAAAEAAERAREAAEAAARARPRMGPLPRMKRGLSREAKIGLAVGGGLLVAGVVAKVVL